MARNGSSQPMRIRPRRPGAARHGPSDSTHLQLYWADDGTGEKGFRAVTASDPMLFALAPLAYESVSSGFSIPIATADEIANQQVSFFCEFDLPTSAMIVSGGVLYVGDTMGFVAFDANPTSAPLGSGGAAGLAPWACGVLTGRSHFLSFNTTGPASLDYFAIGFWSLVPPPAGSLGLAVDPGLVLQNYATADVTDADFAPNAFVVDATFVYWTDASGAIGRVPLP